MNPPVPDELISAYFDGEVTPEERGQVEQLLDNSVELRQFLDDTSKLSALLHSFPRESAPPELASNVQKRVNAAIAPLSPAVEPARRSLRREFTAAFMGIMATLACLVVVSVSINHSKTSDRTAELGSAPSRTASTKMGRVNTSVEEKVATLSDIEALNRPSSPSPDVKSSKEQAPAIAVNRLSREELALPESESQISADSNSLFAETGLEPQSLDELLAQLNNVNQGGNFYVKQVIDANNAVMVVEFTVVDIEKGGDEMRLLLQRRKVPQVEVAFDDTNANAGLPRTVSRRKRPVSRDEMLVIFVRAPGPQLAEMLNESIKEHRDVYKRGATELPIELPTNGLGNTVNVAANDAISDAPAFDKIGANIANNTIAANERQTVAAEASVTVNLYANRKGMKVDNDNSDEASQKLDEVNTASKVDFAMKKDSARGVATAEAKSLESLAESSKADPSAARGGAASSNSADAQSSQGYSLFHVAVDEQRQTGQNAPRKPANSQSNEDRTFSFQAPVNVNSGNQLGNSIPFGNANQLGRNYANTQSMRSNSRQQVARQSSDGQDPQLVRMLIVLKAEPLAGKSAP